MVELYTASAFCKGNAGGNKAGVVLDSTDLTAADMSTIAKEAGYSETAFLTETGAANYRIRYFTPTAEVPICGHATIASFAVLNQLNKSNRNKYTIETGAGTLHIRIETDGMIFMEQDRPSFFEKLEPDIFTGCLETEWVSRTLPVQVVSTGLRDIMLPIDSAAHLEALKPDFSAMTELCRKCDVVGIHAFTLTKGAGQTALCRNFAPRYGINEESATGTSNCALACYLFRYVQRQNRYVMEQGRNLAAASRLVVEIAHQDDAIDTVYVGGYGRLPGRKTLFM